MPAACAVRHCRNRNGALNGAHMHKLPANEPVRSLWLKALGRLESGSYVHMYVCSNHFEEAAYERHPVLSNLLGYQQARPRLRADAVPTCGLDDTENIGPPRRGRKPKGAGANHKHPEGKSQSDVGGVTGENVIAEASIQPELQHASTQTTISTRSRSSQTPMLAPHVECKGTQVGLCVKAQRSASCQTDVDAPFQPGSAVVQPFQLWLIPKPQTK